LGIEKPANPPRPEGEGRGWPPERKRDRRGLTKTQGTSRRHFVAAFYAIVGVVAVFALLNLIEYRRID
jgi:hypothetical protein